MDSVGKFAKIMNYGKALFKNLRRTKPIWASVLAAQMLKSGNCQADTAKHIESMLTTLAKESGSSFNVAISATPAQPIVSPLIKLKNINPNTPILDMRDAILSPAKGYVKINEKQLENGNQLIMKMPPDWVKRPKNTKRKPKSGKGSSF